jgi:very-short-patch-repair endonuclease
VISQVLLQNLFPDPSRLTAAQRSYVQHRASVDFVVYNRVTNQPLMAIEVDGFAFHENNPAQRARDALKDEILAAHQMPLLRLPTTGSGEHQRIRQALDRAEFHWARRPDR